MEVNVEERRVCRLHAAAQRRFDQVDVIETLRAMQVNDQMHAGTPYAVADREMILPRLAARLDDGDMRDLLARSPWTCQRASRSQESVLTHRLPSPTAEPTRVPTGYSAKRMPLDQAQPKPDQQRHCPK